MNKTMFQYIGEGVIRALIFTIIAIVIFSAIGNYSTIPPVISSTFYIVITMLSIIYGAIFATRKINKNGWINGLLVSAVYLVFIVVISKLAGNDSVIGASMIIRIVIGLAVGMLSGMLGINI